MLNRFPLVYTTTEQRPAWLPTSVAMTRCRLGFGCDAVDKGQGQMDGGGGYTWGGPWKPGPWKVLAPGAWVLFEGHTPQHFVRANPHPRVKRHRNIVGADPSHRWLVPVLISPIITPHAISWASALDRVYQHGEWRDSEDLAPLIEQLMAAANSPTFRIDDADNNAALTTLALDLIRITHHFDDALLSAGGWFTEGVMARVIVGACDYERDPS